MKLFAYQAGFSVLSILLVLSVDALLVWNFFGEQALPAVLAAGGVSLPVGIVLAALFYVWGTEASVVVVGAVLRVVLTLGLGFLVAWLFGYWNQLYFMTLAILYLTNLVVETWLAYEQTVKN
ncbi:MAG TPA: hypothetical protein VNQ76_03810 [Planctomicrobium sp.]|nr:hypothetical protein [Planctomicrobium sp.]